MSASTLYRSKLQFLDLRFLAVVTLAIGLGITGCGKTIVNAQTTHPGADPADANMAPLDPNALAANTDQAARAPGIPVAQSSTATQGAEPVDSQQQDSPTAQSTQQQPIQNESQQRADEYRRTGRQEGAQQQAQQPEQMQEQAQPQDQNALPDQNVPPPDPNQGYPQDMQQPSEDQIDAGQQALEADQPPPSIPDYEQPEAPAPNYIWTPGYWYYSPAGYYWVPGAWAMAPYPGALWTPGYWIFIGGHHWRWHHGGWGLHMGFYGGINYGCGYTGYGYHGGYWNGNTFFYNRTVNRVNIRRVPNVYFRNVEVNNVTRISYNGGPGGIANQPRPAELAAMREVRTPAMRAQIENRRLASETRAQFFSENRGRPAVGAVAHPLAADRGIARPMPGSMPSQVQSHIWYPAPSEPAGQIHSGQPQVQYPARPGQPVQQVRPGQPQVQPVRPEVRPTQPGQPPHVQTMRPVPQPYLQPTQPQVRPQPPMTRPEYRPGEQNIRPVEPRPQPQPQPQLRHAPEQQVRPAPQQWYRPQAQPQTRPVPEQTYRPQPQVQPVPQYRPQPQPEYQSRPVPSPQMVQPRPMPQVQPMPQYRPEYQSHPVPQYRPQPQAMPQQQQPRQGSQPPGGGDRPHR